MIEQKIQKTYRMIITTQNDQGRPVSEHIRHIPESELQDRRDALRRGMPQGSSYEVKVLDEN